MPEILGPEIWELATELSRAEEKAHAEFRYLEKNELEHIVKEYDAKVVGDGAECVVIAEEDHLNHRKWYEKWKQPLTREDVVVAIGYRKTVSPEKAKEIFYTHRVMSTLFPNNFPKFFSSFGSIENQEGINATVREHIYPANKNSKNTLSNLDAESPYPFENVQNITEMLNLPTTYDTSEDVKDNTMINFIKGENKGVYYLDTINTRPDASWNSQKIIDWMNNQDYSDIDIRIVRTSIERLNYLKEHKQK